MASVLSGSKAFKKVKAAISSRVETSMEEEPIISKFSTFENESFLGGIHVLLQRTLWFKNSRLRQMRLFTKTTFSWVFVWLLNNVVEPVIFLSDSRGVRHAIDGAISLTEAVNCGNRNGQL